MKKILLLLLFLLPLAGKAQKVYHIKFTSKQVLYSVGVVVYSDNIGTMRVRYDTPKGTKLIEMAVVVKESEKGYTIDGSSPYDVYTGSTTGYNADHFFVGTNEAGETYCQNSDDASSNSQCCIMEVQGKYNQSVFLKEFDWSLE